MSESNHIPENESSDDNSDHDDAFFQETIGKLDDDTASPNRDAMNAATIAAGRVFAGRVFSDHQHDADDSLPATDLSEDSKMISLARPLSAIAAIAAAILLIMSH